MIKTILRIAAIILAWFAGWYILERYEYLIAFSEIDNVVGMLPVAMVIVGVFAATAILWLQPGKQEVPLLATGIVLIILSVVLFPLALRGNWWINPSFSEESEATPDLTVYAPFSVGAKTARLKETSQLQLKDKPPVLDGAKALYPLYAAFAAATYDESTFLPESVLCTNTRGAYEAVIQGKRDIIFVARASEQQLELAQAAGVELKFTPIGREAFVFLVGKDNPLDNLTYQQIRNIYSGKTAEWKTLGWDGGGRIIAFQRPEGSGSQTGLQKIMGTLPIQVPQPLPDKSLIGTNSLMQQVAVEWQGVQPALGYSYKYYATVMYANPDTKLLRINGAEPSTENIQNGNYPFVADFYAVTKGEPTGNAKLLIDWILSPQGQEIIAKTGYTPLLTES